MLSDPHCNQVIPHLLTKYCLQPWCMFVLLHLSLLLLFKATPYFAPGESFFTPVRHREEKPQPNNLPPVGSFRNKAESRPLRDDGSVPSYNDRLEQQLARARVRWAEWLRERIHLCVITYASYLLITSNVPPCPHSPHSVLLLLCAYSYVELSLRGPTNISPRGQNTTKLLACRDPYREQFDRRSHGTAEPESFFEVIVARPQPCVGASSANLPVGPRELLLSGGAV